jgi:RimJ/RimL family protein N-acetyltransferase
MSRTLLLLRPLQCEDAPVVAGWGEDALFRRHAGWTATSRAALHEFWLRQVTDPPGELTRLAVEDPAEGVLVGYVDLHGSDPGEKELGFVIGP